MAVDPYSPCPCGSGKKLRFCCSDLAAEIEKIHTMVEGDQPRAALAHVEQVLAKKPARESLLDLKVMLELTLDDLDAAHRTIEEFVKVAPKNPSAYAQQAVLVAAREGGRAAVLPLQQALALVEQDMPKRVLEAIGSVGQALLMEGNVLAARAHLWLYQGIAGDDDTRALQLLVRLNQMAGLPLALRDHLYLHPAPEGHPGEADHNRAQWYAGSGRWLPAAQAFDSLCGLYPDQPTIAYNRGLVYGWLGDTPRFVAGMREFAAGDVPEQEAVEAEAIAQLLDPAQQEEAIDVVRVSLPITDEEALTARFAANPQMVDYEIDPSEHAEIDGPPPRNAYLMLDKPQPETGVGIGREEVPSIVGIVSHFGRQTDRGERLEVVIDKNDQFEEFNNLLRSIAGDAVGEPEGEESIGKSDAAEQALSWRWHFPPDTPPARRRELLAEQRRAAILGKWPETPRAALNGKTPTQAADDPELRIPLMAAVALLEQGKHNHKYAETFAQLRQKLGLPLPPPIEPDEDEAAMAPLSRVPRMALGGLSDEGIVQLYRRAVMAGATAATLHAAREAIRRPSLGERLPPREAYERLIAHEDDTPKALELVEEARRASDAAGESNALWDMLELELHVVEGQPEEANRVLQHLRVEHGDEPGVAEQLYQLLYALGATPENVPADPSEPAPLAAEPQPAGVGDSSSKIWTPDDEAGGGGQKLWTPS